VLGKTERFLQNHVIPRCFKYAHCTSGQSLDREVNIGQNLLLKNESSTGGFKTTGASTPRGLKSCI
jgi:hypothetical protein